MRSYSSVRWLLVIVGAIFAAVAIELFLLPNNIIDGGIIGISLILNRITSINFGLLVFLLNIPFLYIGYKHLGKSFFVYSLLGIIGLAATEAILHQFHFAPITDTPLLATIFGGLLLGIGVGIVIRNGGAMDGTEILSLLITKRLPFTVGECVLVFNIFVFAWAVFVFGIENAMYSVLTYYVAAKAIDTVVEGLDSTKAVMIVSSHYDELTNILTQRLGKGVTRLKGQGGYEGDEKDVLYVVVKRMEIMQLKKAIYAVDKHAFFTIINAHESRGSTFKRKDDH
ncbi:YitT family protein [Alkalihalobacillus sp. LMS6]|uniref:YitT family protein n=1 Tax=Alkalihalobacillus sp. LMS6 TaxID=2924034 RepID=UPI000C07C5D3|nr:MULTISPECIES: YitT family protein [Bacillaceae]UTR08292.1 YitT family protein [Alkalihalobacillus sp. LMS6]